MHALLCPICGLAEKRGGNGEWARKARLFQQRSNMILGKLQATESLLILGPIEEEEEEQGEKKQWQGSSHTRPVWKAPCTCS